MKWRCHFCVRFWPSWCGGNWMRYCLKQNLTSWKNQKTFAIRTMRERMLTLGQANDAQLGRSSPNFSSMKGGRDSNSERDAYEPVLVHQSLLLTAWQFCMDFTHSCMSFSFLFPKYFFQQLFFLQKVFTRRHFEKKNKNFHIRHVTSLQSGRSQTILQMWTRISGTKEKHSLSLNFAPTKTALFA